MKLYPIFLKLVGRRVLVVGGGRVGESKTRGLLRTGARVRLVAPRATPRLRQWALSGRIDWARREFVSLDLLGAALAVVATGSPAVNDRIARLARRRGALVNVVDEPERCDFYAPAVLRRGPLAIAISTSGCSPAFARRLRLHLERRMAPGIGKALRRLERRRRKLITQPISPAERKRQLIRLAREIPLEGEQ